MYRLRVPGGCIRVCHIWGTIMRTCSASVRSGSETLYGKLRGTQGMWERLNTSYPTLSSNLGRIRAYKEAYPTLSYHFLNKVRIHQTLTTFTLRIYGFSRANTPVMHTEGMHYIWTLPFLYRYSWMEAEACGYHRSKSSRSL
jgi:hypothetical protein